MRVAVLGAGSIGCYLGGRLQAAGHDVVLIGRAKLARECAEHGLTLSSLHGDSVVIEPSACTVETSADAAAGADIALIATKSGATAAAAASLGRAERSVPTIVSAQNGIRNAGLIAQQLHSSTVIPAMIPFNVVKTAPGCYHQASRGSIALAAGYPELVTLFTSAGIRAVAHPDMPALQWGKLVLNLNNAVNGLSGLPLREQLSRRPYRRVLAAAQREALHLLRAAGQPFDSPISAPLAVLPLALEAPTRIFLKISAEAVAIDSHARSSLFDDLHAGRSTEIDYINGEIVALAKSLGRRAPVNETLVRLVHLAERTGRTWSGPELLAEMDAARRGRPPGSRWTLGSRPHLRRPTRSTTDIGPTR
ncbi:2-dehydropantoate 2-reductase [Rhodococcus sp. B7740]|uniref:2-dehydropantoate 2-reductase n=1 Tax=Rhodococcus sp. B7740 TaxID=1564114 RepID=UPI0005D86628|nr:2-dehydropantoate 2-reductase [Rhodococcus sp. B7740]AJW40247.1 2-dehydropantoate 2-reductase [Rhodococcus sp. B7740]